MAMSCPTLNAANMYERQGEDGIYYSIDDPRSGYQFDPEHAFVRPSLPGHISIQPKCTNTHRAISRTLYITAHPYMFRPLEFRIGKPESIRIFLFCRQPDSCKRFIFFHITDSCPSCLCCFLSPFFIVFFHHYRIQVILAVWRYDRADWGGIYGYVMSYLERC